MVKHRSGFSLIELIVSIVIIAITSISVPAIISVTSNLNKQSLLAEAVLNSRAMLELVLKSPYSCLYINEHPNEPLPRFVAGGLIDPNPHDINFAQTSTISKNFYIAYNLKDERKRRKFQYLQNTADINTACDKSTIKSIDSFKGLSKTIAYDGASNRDFMVSARYVIDVSSANRGSFNSDKNIQDYDMKHVSVSAFAYEKKDSNTPSVVLNSFVSNIGDSPNIQTKVFK